MTTPSLRHPVLSDGRTTLRRLTVSDAAALAAIHRDPLNVRWTQSQADMGVREAADLIEGSIDSGWDAGTYLRFGILETRAGVDTIVGTLSLQNVFSTSDGGSASVGIKMLPSGRGTGSAQRAMELLCGYAFGTLGLEILHWHTTDGNRPSTELARRCGFVLAAKVPGFGRVDGRVADGLMLALSREQFHSAPAPEVMETAPVVPAFRTETVHMRALTMADAPQLVENCRDADAVRWTTVPLDYTPADAELFIGTLVPQGWATGETLTFAVADPATDTLLGTVDLQCKMPGAASIGINFGPHARGTGAAEASVRLLLDYAFDQLNLQFVHWIALVPNWGSRKLAWKLGFHYDGQIRGDYNDRGTPSDRWTLSLAAGEDRFPQEPWTGPAAASR